MIQFIISLILFFSCSISVVHSMEEQRLEHQKMQFDKKLLKPDQKVFPFDKAQKAVHAKKILDKSNWQQFYHSFKPFIQELTVRFTKGKSRQPENSYELYDRIWFSYLIAGAPLYETNLDSNELWLYMDDNDIHTKVNAANIITSTEPDLIAKQFNIPDQQVKQLNCTYFATIIKSLRTAYLPDLEQQVTKITDDIFKKYTSDEVQWRNKLNILNAMQTRSNSIQFYLSTSLEEEFLRMLISYFPGRKGEVIKYIKMAGYEPIEINSLIDRTVGREPKTEFLYKGRTKKSAK